MIENHHPMQLSFCFPLVSLIYFLSPSFPSSHIGCLESLGSLFCSSICMDACILGGHRALPLPTVTPSVRLSWIIQTWSPSSTHPFTSSLSPFCAYFSPLHFSEYPNTYWINKTIFPIRIELHERRHYVIICWTNACMNDNTIIINMPTHKPIRWWDKT